MTISGVVADSRKLYERYRFSITEDSKTKTEMFDDFGGASRTRWVSQTIRKSRRRLCYVQPP